MLTAVVAGDGDVEPGALGGRGQHVVAQLVHQLGGGRVLRRRWPGCTNHAGGVVLAC